MDQIASALLSFPTQDLSNNDKYNAAAKAHVKQLNQLKQNEPALLATHAPNLLQHVDPVFNTISYAYLLEAIYHSQIELQTKLSDLPDDLAECTAKFLLTFDDRQIRYAGASFSSILQVLYNGDAFPDAAAVELLATALLRLDPTGSIFTSHHLPLLNRAYQTNNISGVLPVISKSIVFYPGMRGQTETRPLCDTSLPSSAYISVESGLTARVTSAEVLEYDLVSGLAHLSLRDWASASAAFERVCAFPTRDGGCSDIMAQAYNKWILVNLILDGRLRPASALGSHVTPWVLRTFQTVGKPYITLAKAFEKDSSEGGAAELKAEIEAGAAFWSERVNTGLVNEVQQAYQRHHILCLREIYSKIGLEDIRLETHSAETGTPLDTTADVEALLRKMIAAGMLAGQVVKPPGAVEGDGQGHLAFLPEDQEMTEERFAVEVEEAAQRIHGLQAVIKVTDERLGTSKDYIRHLVKEQRREEKDGLVGAGGGGMLSDPLDAGFDSQIEDEDLMTGVQVAGGA